MIRFGFCLVGIPLLEILLLAGCGVIDAVQSHPDEAQGLAFGPESSGLRAALVVDPSYRVGQEIVPDLVVWNTSNRIITVDECGFYTNHEVRLHDAAGRVVPPTSMGQTLLGTFNPYGPRRKNLPIDLAPGEQSTRPFPHGLDQLFALEPGRAYTLQVVYENNNATWTGRLDSAIARFHYGVNKP